MPARLGALVEQLGGTLHGDPELLIEQVASLDTAGPQQIAFMAGAKYRSALDSSRGGAFIVSPTDGESLDRPHIRVRNPALYFARVAQLLNPEPAVRAGIHPGKATPSSLLPAVPAPLEDDETTHFSIIDAQGNRVSTTQTVPRACPPGVTMGAPA